MSLRERIKHNRKLRKIYPNRTLCKSCNAPNTFNFKTIKYSLYSGYAPICKECFNDDEVPFSKILEFYTSRGIYEHDNFSETEIEYIISNLVEETKVNQKFKSKYLKESRLLKINKMFEDDKETL